MTYFPLDRTEDFLGASKAGSHLSQILLAPPPSPRSRRADVVEEENVLDIVIDHVDIPTLK